MDWVDGDPLGLWLDKNYNNPQALGKARMDFKAIAAYLARQGIAHGDIQNGNVMMSNSGIKLTDYDGMFVPGLSAGNGSEVGHKHFQHPQRGSSDYGASMDRFSFIVLDLSLQATAVRQLAE
jgi:serine/threonine protein kinase